MRKMLLSQGTLLTAQLRRMNHAQLSVMRAQVSGDAVLRALQAALENAPSALAARSVLEGFETAVRYAHHAKVV